MSREISICDLSWDGVPSLYVSSAIFSKSSALDQRNWRTALIYQVRSSAVSQFSKMTIFCVQLMVMASGRVSGAFSYAR